MPESDFGKYPSNTPWDEGPLSDLKDQESWTLKLDPHVVTFSRFKDKDHYFLMRKDNREPLEMDSSCARRLYQQLIAEGYKHDPPL